tara:strand:- start:121 stop:825 length:705 start_codon:yes stop_codon:yes gene_type:complete
MNIVSIIPARGGSKSIPRKNIKIVGGSPLIKYSIDYSLECELVNKTVVSTEDEEISKYAKKFNVEVVKRPKNLAKDLTPDYPVIKHSLFVLEKKYKEKIDLLVILRPTSPLRPKKLIEKGIKILKSNPKATSVRAVTEVKQHPYRMWEKNSKYISSFINSRDLKLNEPYNKPRQILPKVFFQTGDIEIVRRSTILAGSVSGNKILPIFLNRNTVFDIDSLEDLKKVESKIKDHE